MKMPLLKMHTGWYRLLIVTTIIWTVIIVYNVMDEYINNATLSPVMSVSMDKAWDVFPDAKQPAAPPIPAGFSVVPQAQASSQVEGDFTLETMKANSRLSFWAWSDPSISKAPMCKNGTNNCFAWERSWSGNEHFVKGNLITKDGEIITTNFRPRFLKILIIWIAPIFFLWSVAWSFCWVKDGFKKEEKK